MKRCSLKRGRRKAPFGEAVVAAGIQAAATMAAAALNNRSIEKNAIEQAKAQAKAARLNADALREQNETSKENQEEMIEFQRNQNEIARNDYNNMMMQIQMAMGQQNEDARLDASKIQVKNGGRKSLKRVSGGNGRFPLRASSNMAFAVTDGGGVDYLGSTPEGFDLYQVVGDTHNQTHKSLGGKRKTGVGFKFEDGNVIEAEGNGDKKENGGELLLTTPNDAYFISKHNIEGFNPREAVMNGMHPLDAFNMQENIKNMNGISDSGYAKYGRTLRGCRRKADLGTWWNGLSDTRKLGYANWAGAGIGALGNFGGALLSTIGNNRAADIAAEAASSTAGIIADAYRSLTPIDLSIIKSSDYDTGSMIPAFQTVRSTNNSGRASVERARDRMLTLAGRNNLSSANAQSLANRVESNSIDALNTIADKEEQLKDAIRARNMQAANEAQRYNLMAATQARKDYASHRLSLAMQNNELENAKRLGIANAYATAAGTTAQLHADAASANATAWGNALASTAGDFAGTLTTNAKREFDALQAKNKHLADMENTFLGADTEGKLIYIATHLDDPEARRLGMNMLGALNPDSESYARLSRMLGINYNRTYNPYFNNRGYNVDNDNRWLQSGKFGKHIRRSLKR